MSEPTKQSDGDVASAFQASQNRLPNSQAQQERLDNLRDAIFTLGLERNIVELELYGYTILKNAMPPAFFDALRDRLLVLDAEDKAAGRKIPIAGPDNDSRNIFHALPRGGALVEQAVMAEKPLTLVTYLLGESCQLSSVHGHIRAQGDPPQDMHADASYLPDPLPEWNHVCNVMWCMDDFSEEAGGTYVVPGSHKKRRHPEPHKARDNAVPVNAAKGDLFVFGGNLWHGAGARKLVGERVGMTAYFSRMYARQQEPLADLVSDEAVERNPPRFAELIGRHNPYPFGAQKDAPPHMGKYYTNTPDARG